MVINNTISPETFQSYLSFIDETDEPSANAVPQGTCLFIFFIFIMVLLTFPFLIQKSLKFKQYHVLDSAHLYLGFTPSFFN
jgi:hypothetical protein